MTSRAGNSASRGLFEKMETTMTREQLALFIKTRRESGFSSNLQFQIDANASGFTVTDLGPVRKFTLNGATGYQWSPVLDDGTSGLLVEYGAYLFTPETDSTAARHFFSHDYKDAEFEKAA
jgi:hypothetical protein